VLDLRPAPAHAAELTSQLLMGETVLVRTRAREPGWARVRNDADGYEGWVRTWGLVAASAERAERWRRLARGRIPSPRALVTSGRGSGGGRAPVFFGTRLIASPVRGGWSAVELPDGRRGYLPGSALAGPRPPKLEARVASLLGAPYLWGGRSPAGYDCSAFVQQVLLEQGVSLPRDAREQCRRSRRLTRGELPGDLAFFRTAGEPASHVGIALGGGYFAHCRGRVTIASLEAGNRLFDNDL